MMYNRVYSTHHRSILKHWFGAPVIYPKNIYEYNAGSAFVYDIYDVEQNNLWDIKRVSAHVAQDPRSAVFVNLTSENTAPTPDALSAYVAAVQAFDLPPDRITVLASQNDVLDYMHKHTGANRLVRNLWETHSALTVQNYPTRLEPTHRICCLNRRYTPERAWAIHQLWPHRKHLYYTLGAGPAWFKEDDVLQYQRCEWEGYDWDKRNSVFEWQQHTDPWQNLNDTVSHDEWDTGHLLAAQARGAVSLVVESRIRSRLHRSEVFLTEKTYRCIALGIPFVLWAGTGARRTLQSQGYALPKYSDAIDYTISLCRMTDKQFRKEFTQLKRVAKHNLQVFKERHNNAHAAITAAKR